MKGTVFLMVLILGIGTSFSQAQTQKKEQQRTQLQEHFMYQDGQMLRIREGEQMQLREKMQLKNGITINPDGTYQLKNGKQKQFKAGECMGLDGKRFKNQNAFRTQQNKMMQKQMKNPAGQKGKKSSGKKGGKGN
ncbi:MAG: DUF6799 domain-containing protein [Cyclobacteriaceae bacterium]